MARAAAGMNEEMRNNVAALIWRVSMRWRAAADRVLEPLGLTHAQYSVLAPLYGMSRDGAKPSQRELADATGLDAVYISKLVRVLERDGFVTRLAKTTDPRAFELALTDAGLRAVREGVTAVTALRDQLTQPLGGIAGERTAELAGLLRELLDAFESPG